ncbi:MAG: hypothetical protein AAF358_02930 [Pseudomonadota bacterium]
MGRRVGILAAINRELKRSARENERRIRQREKDRLAAARKLEAARRQEEKLARKLAAAKVASDAAEKKRLAAEQKRLEKELKAAHIASMEREAEDKNSVLESTYSEIDGLLEATLAVDDYVDLETLRGTVKHPPFEHPELENPLPEPKPPELPVKPIFAPPPAPRGLKSILGKKKFERELKQAKAAHTESIEDWKRLKKAAAVALVKAKEDWKTKEAARKTDLANAKKRYRQDCDARERKVEEQNRNLDTLIANLGYGTEEAVQEYVSIVLSNSIYPDTFPVSHDFDFDSKTAELDLKVSIPSPDEIPAVKHYKYNKTADEIKATNQTQKASKDRYLLAVQRVSLRSFHEVFEADRRGLIHSIKLVVGTSTTDPATGQETNIPFIAASAAREEFLKINLAKVVPGATLEMLGASVSKNPLGLVAVNVEGVRSA